MPSRRILVVDRDPHVLQLVRDLLPDDEVIGAAGPEEALGLMAAATPELDQVVLTEILLAGGDGLALCKTLRKNMQKVAVIVCTMLAAEERARAAGADEYLRKPLNSDRLRSAVERALDAHRSPAS